MIILSVVFTIVSVVVFGFACSYFFINFVLFFADASFQTGWAFEKTRFFRSLSETYPRETYDWFMIQKTKEGDPQ